MLTSNPGSDDDERTNAEDVTLTFHGNEGTPRVEYNTTVNRSQVKTTRNVRPCLLCSDHQEEALYFCTDHGVDCCDVCLPHCHEECATVPLQAIRSTFSRYHKRVKRVLDNVAEQEDNLSSYGQSIESHFKLCEKRIQNIYNGIRRKIDDSEKQSMKKLEEVWENKISRLSLRLSEYEELKKQMTSIIQEGEQVRDRNDTMELVTLPQKLESHVAFIEGKLAKLNKLCDEVDNDLVKKNDSSIKTIFSHLNQVVALRTHPDTDDVTVADCECSLNAFIFESRFSCSAKVNSINWFHDKDGALGLLVVTEKPNRLQHLTIKGEVLRWVRLPNRRIPYDLCIYKGCVAVTMHSLKRIHIYQLPDLTHIRNIQLSSNCWGICRLDDTLIVAFPDDDVIRCIDDKGEIISESDKLFNCPSFVRPSWCCRRVFVSDTGNDRVVALSRDLKNVTCVLSHPDLQYPLGLCIGAQGGVYVCSYWKHSVVEFTNDGEFVTTMEKDGVNYPDSLCYDAGCRMLVVSMGGADKLHIYRAE